MNSNINEKQNIGSLFDRIAGTYDRLNHLLSLNEDRRWRKVAVRGMNRADKVLDVAVGTADLTIELLRRDKAQSVTGIDLSDEMMALGKDKLARLSYDRRAELIHASALDMPFDDASFDAVTCAYGVRNFSDLDKGLAEMHRVLKKGGELMILEFSYPSNRFVAWVYNIYFSHVLPWVGRLFSRDPNAYSYLNRSVRHFIWGEEMCSHLREAGFEEVRFRTLSLGITTVYRAFK